MAADSLATAGDIKVHNRSKIRILKQCAIATAGTEIDGFRFEKWYFEQNGEPFIVEESFCAMLMTKDQVWFGEIRDNAKELQKLWIIDRKMASGASAADSAAEILMRDAKFNAHRAALSAANYHTHCGPPVYSITRNQLRNIDPDFKGFWIGSWDVPIKKIKDYLITDKQWLKT